MKTIGKLALATVVAVATLGGIGRLADAAASAPTAPATPDKRVYQWHGSVLKPAAVCGIRVSVQGRQGTQFEIYTTGSDGVGSLPIPGSIPVSPGFTWAVSIPGCEMQRPTELVHVFSVASAPIAVDLMYW